MTFSNIACGGQGIHDPAQVSKLPMTGIVYNRYERNILTSEGNASDCHGNTVFKNSIFG